MKTDTAIIIHWLNYGADILSECAMWGISTLDFEDALRRYTRKQRKP